jgi:hypothetical protein
MKSILPILSLLTIILSATAHATGPDKDLEAATKSFYGQAENQQVNGQAKLDAVVKGALVDYNKALPKLEQFKVEDFGKATYSHGQYQDFDPAIYKVQSTTRICLVAVNMLLSKATVEDCYSIN